MAGFSNLNKEWSSIEALERELNLKQLQINRLLNITQAINNNVSAEGLYEMYRSFLSWEMGVNKMALYIRQVEGEWKCATSIGVSDELLRANIGDALPQFTRLRSISEEDHPLLSEFDVVIPVSHKNQPIAYVFIGGFGENEDMYSKVQFITTITNVIAVAIENKRLFRRQLEQERLKQEIELGSEIQQLLIPKAFPKKEAYELAGVYQPRFGVGGDYFDFLESADNKIVFCVGDISGKGVSAALLMANFQANFHTLINKRTELDEFIVDINKSINLITEGNWFITFFIAEYDINERRLQYINAGHNPPLLVCQNKITPLDKGCTILGSFQELPELEVGVQKIEDEAIIFSFTDGLTDLTNDEGEFLNEKMVQDFALENYRLPASDFNAGLMERIEQFKGDANYPDDFTLLTCRIF